MNTLRSLLLSIATSAAVFLAAPAATAEPIGRKEVHLNAKNFAKLSEQDKHRVLELQSRIADVLATDRNSLSKEERVELRNEWKTLKGEMDQYNRNGSVIYISTAGLIIIILLLIILL
ncbi:MAG: hypothetical protein IT229_06795 [Flavobacteriales bacterium]|nr:hypothetical protein [Flavobacteriales bacterium]